MSHVKKGQQTASPEWAKHLRPDGKREFWKRERLSEQATAREEAEAERDEGGDADAQSAEGRSE